MERILQYSLQSCQSRILEVNGKPTGLLSYADEAKKAKK